MLAALIQNNNARAVQPGFRVNPRADAGRSRSAAGEVGRDGAAAGRVYYNLVDVLAAAASFPEVIGEDPATRAARRLRWISEALPLVQEEREKREAAAFVAGIQLGAAAVHAGAADREAAESAVEQPAEIRATPSPAELSAKAVPAAIPRGRGATGNLGIVVGLILGGVAIGCAISGSRRAPRRSGRVR